MAFKSKRLLSALLAALMLSSAALVACSDDQGEAQDTTDAATVADTTTAAPETEDPRLKDDLPEKQDLNNYTYLICTQGFNQANVAWLILDIEAEAENGERINDATFKRNKELKERFNVNIKMDAPDQKAEDRAKTSIMNGEKKYDAVGVHSQSQANLALAGVIVNMNKIKYLDFSKAWYDTQTIEQLEIAGKTYFAGGSATLNSFRATWGVLFNKLLATNAQLEDPYQLVRDGKWTLDKLVELAKKVTKDQNGDGNLEYAVDTYGIFLQDEVALPLFLGVGARLTQINKDGSFKVVMDSELAVNTCEKIFNFIHADPCILHSSKVSVSDKWNHIRGTFKQDKIGFFMCHLSTPVLIPDMEHDYGILPFPKVDNTQKDYASSFQYNNYWGYSIPKDCKDFDRTGLITEALFMTSHDTVREAWYDYTLTIRSSRDEGSAEMLDIIFGARGCDVAFVFNPKTKMQTIMQQATNGATFNYASTVAEQKKVLETQMQEILTELAKHDA